jgi:hypothetical protein
MISINSFSLMVHLEKISLKMMNISIQEMIKNLSYLLRMIYSKMIIDHINTFPKTKDLILNKKLMENLYLR